MTRRVILVGLAAAVLSQYAWLIPIPQAYLVCAVTAAVCAATALILTALDRLARR